VPINGPREQGILTFCQCCVRRASLKVCLGVPSALSAWQDKRQGIKERFVLTHGCNAWSLWVPSRNVVDEVPRTWAPHVWIDSSLGRRQATLWLMWCHWTAVCTQCFHVARILLQGRTPCNALSKEGGDVAASQHWRHPHTYLCMQDLPARAPTSCAPCTLTQLQTRPRLVGNYARHLVLCASYHSTIYG
jgi:hypothetical protein